MHKMGERTSGVIAIALGVIVFLLIALSATAVLAGQQWSKEAYMEHFNGLSDVLVIESTDAVTVGTMDELPVRLADHLQALVPGSTHYVMVKSKTVCVGTHITTEKTGRQRVVIFITALHEDGTPHDRGAVLMNIQLSCAVKKVA